MTIKEYPIKMVVCDLDGTLLYSSSKVSEATKKAIQSLRQSGVLFGVCSGRSAVALQQMLKVWGIDQDVDFVLGFNGGMYWDPTTDKFEEDFLLEPEAIPLIFEACHGFGLHYAEYQGHEMLSTIGGPISRRMAQRNKLKFHIVKKEALIRPTLKLMAFGMPWSVSRWLESDRRESLEGIARVFRSGPFLLEFVHPSLSKLEGVKKAAQKFGVDLGEVVSFGNDNNDLEMVAGTFGVAMNNALDEVKKVACAITDSNRNDGVAKFIENYILPINASALQEHEPTQ